MLRVYVKILQKAMSRKMEVADIKVIILNVVKQKKIKIYKMMKMISLWKEIKLIILYPQ